MTHDNLEPHRMLLQWFFHELKHQWLLFQSVEEDVPYQKLHSILRINTLMRTLFVRPVVKHES